VADPFDARLYIEHLRRRWRFAAAVVGAALLAASFLTWMQTPRYTAKVSLVIEPPASNDPRAATAVSPIYFESLRSYEHLAASSHLFAEAVEKFGLREGSGRPRPLEALKKSVLRVSIPRNTKILEIGVTLPDAKKAHALALHIATQTVELNRKTARESDEELTNTARREADAAAVRFKTAEAALQSAQRQPPTPAMLEAELERLAERRAELERLSLSAALSAADQEDRIRAARDRKEDAGLLNARLQSTRAHAARLRQEHESVAAEVGVRQKALAARKAELDVLAAEYKSAQEARDESDRRLRGILATSGFRTERLTILDPGFVPEQPSSPSLRLNLFLAASLSLIVSLVWLTVQFGLSSLKAEPSRPRLSRIAAKP
jgi:capsular polysaccharide biosynthesis protein